MNKVNYSISIALSLLVLVPTQTQLYQETSAQLGEFDTFNFQKTDRQLQELLDAFALSPIDITEVLNNEDASYAERYSVEEMYNICLILIARESSYGNSCESIVVEVNNNDQARIDQEVQNVKDLMEEEAAKPPVPWWEDNGDSEASSEESEEESGDE